ncbi:unnamed protein product, partial [Ixodes hexagonus]
RGIADGLCPAFGAESAAIEDVLQHLSRGMKLHKVRSLKKYYQRRYQLNLDNMLLVYRHSRKPFFCSKKPFLDIFDVEEVRKGWKTDVFNDVERKLRRRKHYLPFSSINMSEDTCFSLIVSPKNDTLDLVACNANECELWVRGLRHLIANCKNTRRDQEHERWLRDQFQKADVNRSGSLNFSECQNLLKQLNVSMDKSHCRALFNAANFKCHKVDGEDVLDREEFVKFYHSLLSRPDIDTIFKTYTAHNMTIMGPEELLRFLTQEQKMNVTLNDCKEIIEKYAKEKNNSEGYLGLSGFRDMLLSDDHAIFDKEHNHVCQDMNQPLNHYYIASSHNTYLVQGQLVGSSSVEGYIRALKKGCRCLELDVWDGPDDEPVVYHGYTLTSKILFRDILDSVKLYAFEDSQYPVILSLENHCTTEQQKVMAKHLVEILGAMGIESVRTVMQSSSLSPMHGTRSFTDLKLQYSENAYAEIKLMSGGYAEHHSLTVFVQSKSVEFSCRETKHMMTSLVTAASLKALSLSLSLSLPLSLSLSLSLLALNYQKWDQKMFMNEAKFSLNGRCGYVLMPEFLRKGTFGLESPDPALKRTLVLKVISGQQLPKPLESTDGEVVDPYVVIKVNGHPLDKTKVKTKFIRNNGFNPQWNETFELPIHVPQLAMVMFTVKDESRTGKNMKLAKYALPFEAIKEGYRHVHLRNNAFLSLVPASIFVHVSIKKK